MAFFELKDLIPKSAGRFQLQGELKAAMVINRASATIKELFPEEVNRFIRVKKFKDGVLWIAVTNAAVAQSVYLKSHHIKLSLNDSFGEQLITNVRSIQETPPKEEWFGE